VTMSPRITAYVIGVVVCVIALIAVLSFLSDPFGIRSWFREREENRQAAIASDGIARTLESDGQAEQITRIESAGRLTIDVNAITAEAVSNARNATDANKPIEASRVDRLRRLDDRLCNLRPAACRPTLDTPGISDADVSAPDPSR